MQIHITGNCNCKCKHCYLDSEPNELTVDQIETILVQYKELIDFLQSQFGRVLRPFINITGGEPFMHKNIYGVFDLIEKYSNIFSFRIMTNGLLINQDLIKRIKRLNIPCLQLSLDGGEFWHDQIRGSGNFKAVCERLDLLYENSIPTKVSFTAHSSNFRDFPTVAKICRDHHVSSLWSDRFIPCSQSNQLKALNKDETEEYVSLLQIEKNNKLNREAGLQILNQRSLQFLASKEFPYRCAAGIQALAISDNGDVFPCRRMPVKCGNVFENNLSEIYNTNVFLQTLKDTIVPSECVSCRHAPFCRGGAKCLSYSLYNSVDKKDPGCWL